MVIDSLKFAADGDCVAGGLAIARLPRLAEMLASHAGVLDCRLAGCRERVNGTERLGLRLQITGRLGLLCQRCLTEVGFDCAIDSRLLLVAPGEVWPDDEMEADDYDAIEVDRELSVLTLVEDEILLALPLVPRHADCGASWQAAVAEEEDGPSPFGVLAGLKKH